MSLNFFINFDVLIKNKMGKTTIKLSWEAPEIIDLDIDRTETGALPNPSELGTAAGPALS